MPAQCPPRPPTYTVQDAAKLLGVGPHKLFAWLREHNIFNADNVPYQRYIDSKYFHVHCGQYTNQTTGINQYYARSRITNKGLEWLNKQLHQGEAA